MATTACVYVGMALKRIILLFPVWLFKGKSESDESLKLQSVTVSY